MSRKFTVVITISMLISVAIFVSWRKNENLVEQHSRDLSNAKQTQSDAIVEKMQSDWNADEHWENRLSSAASIFPYTSDLEGALIKEKPTIFYGFVKDVSSTERGTFLVLIKPYTKGPDMQMLLEASPQIATKIVNNDCRLFCTFVFVASVTSIEKLPSPKSTEMEYFLAHGAMKDATQDDVRPTIFLGSSSDF